MRHTNLITHSGSAHADDILSFAVLSTLFSEYNLIRTRDVNIIESTESKIVFDVGFKYDHAENLYDHHQKDKPLRDDDIPYSSFGLVWKHYGSNFLSHIGISGSNIPAVWKSIDKKFVWFVDVGDNGSDTKETPYLKHNTNFFRMVEHLFLDNSDEEFIEAASFLLKILINLCKKEEIMILEKLKVDEQLESYNGNGILELNFSTSLTSYISKDKSINYIVSPREDKWQVYALQKSSETFELRKPLPEIAAGKINNELVESTGIKDLEFCHTGRFIAVGKTKESVLSLATFQD